MSEVNSFERRTAKAAHEIFSAWFANGMKKERRLPMKYKAAFMNWMLHHNGTT